jgi:uncharacterized protein
VPAVQFSSTMVNWILLIGVFMAASGTSSLLLVGIALFTLTVVFSLITPPVEFDPSQNGTGAWLSQSDVTNVQEYPKAKNALICAAITYIKWQL